MQKSSSAASPLKRSAKVVIDFSSELQLLERMHGQLRMVLPVAASTEGSVTKEV
jgi:hypothetical protein